MESMEVEQPTPPPPPQAPIHVAGSDRQAPSSDGTPAPAVAGDAMGADEPPAQSHADDATEAVLDNAATTGADVPEAETENAEGGDGTGDIGELPGLPELPEGDLDFPDERSPLRPSSPDDDFDLAPLPTEFDLDAPLPDIPPSTLPEDDELAIVPREEPEPVPEPVPEPEPEQPIGAEEAVRAEGADGAEGAEQADQDIYAVIRGLADPGLQWGDGEEELEPELEAAAEGDTKGVEQDAMEVDHIPADQAREASAAREFTRIGYVDSSPFTINTLGST